jgi:hypothetical protein
MAQHLTSRELQRLLLGDVLPSEIDIALEHLLECRECWQRSASALRHVPSGRHPAPKSDQLSALLCLLREEERKALEYLRSRSLWTRLRDQEPEHQRNRLRASAELRTQTFFRIILEDATVAGFSDPYRGEQGALLARDVAAFLPDQYYPYNLRRDFEAEALTVVANCRRLASDWQGSSAAIKEAKERLEHGTGNRARFARLLSIHASLACDTGNLEAALDILARAGALYKEDREIDGLAGIIIQEAAILLIAGRADDAIDRAGEVLAIGALSTRLEMIAKSLITEALIVAKRAGEALLAYHKNRDLYAQFPDFGLRVGYLEGRLLEALGYEEDSESLLKHVAEEYWHSEQYKEAFRTLFALFEVLYRRSSFTKAENICEEAVRWIELAGTACHHQIKLLWQLLGEKVRQRLLDEVSLAATRLYLIRNWSVPASALPFDREGESSPIPRPDTVIVHFQEFTEPRASEQRWISAVDRPTSPDELASGAYLDAVDKYDRDLILAALARCNSEIKPTARFLGISRNSLRFKLKKYQIGGR